MGFVELITLLLSLTGFGVQANPKAPTADQSLQYAMPDPDVVVHLDAVTFVPNNYKLLAALPNKPEIKASPELSQMVFNDVDFPVDLDTALAWRASLIEERKALEASGTKNMMAEWSFCEH